MDVVEWIEGHISGRLEFANDLSQVYDPTDYDDDDLQILDHSREYLWLYGLLGIKPKEIISKSSKNHSIYYFYY